MKKLQSVKSGKIKSFSKDVAERLLANSFSGWKLPEKEKNANRS